MTEIRMEQTAVLAQYCRRWCEANYARMKYSKFRAGTSTTTKITTAVK